VKKRGHTGRPRRHVAALVATLMVAVAIPATASGAATLFAQRWMKASEVAAHPTSRSWLANTMTAANGKRAVRVWAYSNYRDRYAGDSGKQYGKTVVYLGSYWGSTRIYCQNWSTTSQIAECRGEY
jgi:hypothetical protein